MRLLCIAILLSVGCHDHTHDDYSTFQACFDEHTMGENLPFNEAVVVCCTDHPIAGVKDACGADSAACVSYLGANLTSTATAAEVMAACDQYEALK